MKKTSPQAQLDGFIARYAPGVGGIAHGALARMRARLPGAVQLVYDNYNALAIGFGPTERASDIVLSIALYPRWVSLFFARGTLLRDPEKLLRGAGKTFRHIVLKDASDLDARAVRALISEALRQAGQRMGDATTGRLVIKSVSAKQRPRRPSGGKRGTR
jgi:hypothetical protein